MTVIVVTNDRDQLGQFGESWDRLRVHQPLFFPKFDELVSFLSDTGADFRVVALKSDNRISSLACFALENRKKYFSIGERRLFRLSARVVSLFGSGILGEVDLYAIKEMLRVVGREFVFDLVSLGEVPVESNLYAAVRAAGLGFIVTSPSRKNSLRWRIDLPDNFDEYLMSLSSKLRKSMRYQIRKLENERECELCVVHRADQIGPFLRDGEAVSRLTYQWNVGQRLCNDEPTRRRYDRRAREGELRCYIVYIAGKPVAFARGEIVDKTYNYETPGFDPEYSRFSIGLVLLLWIIRDLIEHTDCRTFDFGTGGDEGDYKSRFANFSVPCASLELGQWTNPYSVLLVSIQESLRIAKNLASWVLGDGTLRARFKKAIRKYGAK